jgi:hypothetical protein
MIVSRTFALGLALLTGGVLHAAGAAPVADRQAARAGAAITTSLRPATAAMAACLPDVQAQATIVPGPTNDALSFHATGLPPFAGFDLFATGSTRPPYDLAWPLAVVQADAQGTVDAQAQAVLLGASGLAGAGSTHAVGSHLILVFDNPEDAGQCAGIGGADNTPLTNGRTAGPVALTTDDGANPLQAASYALPGIGVSTPSHGRSSVPAAVTFTVACSDPAGWTAIRFIDLRLTNAKTGAVAFWARLDRPAKRMYVYDPATSRWMGGLQPGSAGALSGPLAQLQLQSSRVLGTTGPSGRVLWTVTFSPHSAGQSFRQSVRVIDVRNQTRGWNASGTWSVG